MLHAKNLREWTKNEGQSARRRCERRAEAIRRRGDARVMAGLLASYLWKRLNGAAHTAYGHPRSPATETSGDKEIVAQAARRYPSLLPLAGGTYSYI